MRGHGQLADTGHHSLDDHETRTGWVQALAYVDRAPAPQGSARWYMPCDDDHSTFALECDTDPGRGLATFLARSSHVSTTN